MLYVAGSSTPQAAIREAFDSRLPDARDEHWLCLVVRDRLTHTPLGLTGYSASSARHCRGWLLFAPAAQGRGYGYEVAARAVRLRLTTGGVRRPDRHRRQRGV